MWSILSTFTIPPMHESKSLQIYTHIFPSNQDIWIDNNLGGKSSITFSFETDDDHDANNMILFPCGKGFKNLPGFPMIQIISHVT